MDDSMKLAYEPFDHEPLCREVLRQYRELEDMFGPYPGDWHGYVVGVVMRWSGGNANPMAVAQTIRDLTV